MNPLERIALWDVPHAAAAVGLNGVIANSWGDLHRSFSLASLTKLFTSYATLLAVEEGVITLDDPAGPPGSTIRHLLAHAAGYGFDSGAAVIAAPAQRRIYSNQGMEVLAVAVEKAIGMPFRAYVTEGVLTPLGMTDSTFQGSAAFGMTSTVNDLQKFVVEILTPTVLAPGTVAEALSVHFPGLNGVLPGFGSQRPLDWGLGFERKGTKSPHWTGTLVSPRTVGHFGGAGTFLWIDPERSLSCICLTDRRFGSWAVPLWSELSDAVVIAHDRIG